MGEKKHIIYGVAGLLIGAGVMYLLAKSGKFSNATGGSAAILKKGDKGGDILNFQKNMNQFFRLNGAIPETGMFDKQTFKAVNNLFGGTTVLRGNGIDRNFVNDFNVLINREKEI